MKARVRAAPIPAPELVEMPEERLPGFNRFLGIAIVLATLTAAAVEFAHGYDGMRADQAGLDAQRLGVESTGGLLTLDQRAQSQFETFIAAEQFRVRQATANQQLLNPVPGTNQATATNLERERSKQLATVTQGLTTDITPDSVTGPQQDPGFPSRYFALKQLGANLAWAQQDAANEEAAGWRRITTDLAAVLTMLAVAVYLFGLSLSVKLRVNRVLAVLGVGLVLVGGGWAALLQATSVRRASDQAASEFAQARLAKATAYLKTGAAGYQDAYQHYSRAIELRPTFAQAFAERATVAFAIGSPQATGILNISSADALRKSVADETRAYELGLRTKEVLSNLGNDLFLQSLQTPNQRLSEQGLVYTDQALKLDSQDAITYYNQGVQLLAAGHYAEAQRSYAQAADRTRYVDVAKRQLRDEPVREENWLAGALTDLELVQHYRPNLTGQITSIKESLVRAVTEGTDAVGPFRQVQNLKAETFASLTQWTADLPAYDPKADHVSVQWYYRPPASGSPSASAYPALWSVLPAVSGNVAYDTAGTANFGKLEYEPSLGTDHYFNLNDYLTGTGECLRDGSYRADLYVNGRLAATAQVDSVFGGLTGQIFSDLAIELCRPGAWQPSGKGVRAFTQGYVSPDSSQGVYVFRYEHPGPHSDADQAALTSADLKRTLAEFADRFPGRPVFEKIDTYRIADLAAPVGAYYSYPGGEVNVNAGFTDNGATIVVAVFGPSSYWNQDEPYRINESVFTR